MHISSLQPTQTFKETLSQTACASWLMTSGAAGSGCGRNSTNHVRTTGTRCFRKGQWKRREEEWKENKACRMRAARVKGEASPG
jgi:hypothetical protein